jgi:hypothetical protein
MRVRKQIADELNKPQKGIGLYERQLQVEGLLLEVLLDVRDLLDRSINREVVVDFVPPDYGREDKLT